MVEFMAPLNSKKKLLVPLIWGVALTVLKGLLDNLLATLYFGKNVRLGSRALEDLGQKGFGYYYMLGDTFQSVASLFESRDEVRFHLALLALGLPFMTAGLVLCLCRLKELRIHPWTLILFFIPYVQLLYFALLALLGPDQAGAAEGSRQRMDWLGRL